MQPTNYNLFLSIPEIVNLITSLNLFILFIILIFRRQNTRLNIILAFILLLPSITYINNYLILSSKLIYFPGIVIISQITALLCAPLIYVYVRMFMGKRKNYLSIWHLFTIAAILLCLFHLVLLLMTDNSVQKTFAKQIINAEFPTFLLIARSSFFILLNAYFLDLAIQVWIYSKKSLNINSSLDRIKLRYIQLFIIILWTLNISVLLLYLFMPNFYVDFIVVPVVTGIFYIFLLRTGFNHTAIFTKDAYELFSKSIKNHDSISLKSSEHKEYTLEEVDNIKSRIAYQLDENKLFTDPELQIGKLAEAISLCLHETSFFINTYLHTNFYNLINSKRIELAKEMLIKAGRKAEIEVIGYEVGFNSKSAFYRSFKKYVNCSPSEFLSKNLQ